MAMFNEGDEVESNLYGYSGIVIGYKPDNPRLVRIKRHDGKRGGYGDFWQTGEDSLKLISTASLINE